MSNESHVGRPPDCEKHVKVARRARSWCAPGMSAEGRVLRHNLAEDGAFPRDLLAFIFNKTT
jgi:hypothetical protein